MKKKLLALALSLALCLGLMVPAFAVELPATSTEAVKYIDATADYPAGTSDNDYWVEKAWTFLGWENEDDAGMIDPTVPSVEDGYIAIKKDSKITIRHTGTVDDGTFIRVYYRALVNNGKGYVWNTSPNSYYLTNKDGFYMDFEDPDVEGGGLVELKAGQSITFTLPTVRNDFNLGYTENSDVIFMMRPEIYYPLGDGTYHYYYAYYYLKWDEAAYNAVAGTSASTAAPTVGGFSDVTADAYYAEPVKWAVEKSITSGTSASAFSPNNTCTNAQILTFLWRAYGEPEPSISNPFANDIPDAYKKAAVWAYEKGMVSGTEFDVRESCTRAMAVKYLWQAAGSPASSSAASFTDVPAAASFAQAVAWAVEKGITSGTSADAFSPHANCSRGQIVTFLYRTLS